MAQTMFQKLQIEAGESARGYIQRRVSSMSDPSQLLMLKEIIQANFPESPEPPKNNETVGPGDQREGSKPSAKSHGSASLKQRALDLIRASSGPVATSAVARAVYGEDTAKNRKTANSLLHWLKRDGLVEQDGDLWAISDSEESDGSKGLRDGSIGSVIYNLIANTPGRVPMETVRSAVEASHPATSRTAIYAAINRLITSERIRSHGEGTNRSFSLRRG